MAENIVVVQVPKPRVNNNSSHAVSKKKVKFGFLIWHQIKLTQLSIILILLFKSQFVIETCSGLTKWTDTSCLLVDCDSSFNNRGQSECYYWPSSGDYECKCNSGYYWSVKDDYCIDCKYIIFVKLLQLLHLYILITLLSQSKKSN